MSKDDEQEIPWEQIEEMFPGVNPMNIITPLQLKKRLLWDIVPCDDAMEVIKFMFESPGSEEVEDMEHKQGHVRLLAVAPLVPFVMSMAEPAAEVITSAILVGRDVTSLSEDEVQDSVSKLNPVIAATAIGILAELVDLGVIHLPHYIGDGFVTVGDDE